MKLVQQRSFFAITTGGLLALVLCTGLAFGEVPVSTTTAASGSGRSSASGPLAAEKSSMIRGSKGRELQATCGGGSRGNGVCPNGLCCSPFGWCGSTAAHCTGGPAPTPPSGGGTCGGGSRGNGRCPSAGECCSQWGWCGTSAEHCQGQPTPPSPTPPTPSPPSGGGTCGGGSRGNGICSSTGECCSQWGWCGTSAEHCQGQPTPPSPTPPTPSPPSGGGTCGGGSRGNGVCPSTGECCSQWGWCGTSAEHCQGQPTPPSPSPPSPGPGGSGINSPARTLSLSDLQAGLDMYTNIQGGSVQARQEIVDTFNSVTKDYSLYRQLAFVAHTIWESGGYRYTEEIAATTGSMSARDDYQTCSNGAPATNGKFFYGRGYMQLSWCYNYEAYGQNRMINGDPNYFKNNPDLVAQLPYAVDSAAWFFETQVSDNSGNFGATTRAINGALECGGQSATPQKRYRIFEALANKVGLTSGYSAAGC